jgi:hypothetical protein
MLQSVVRKRIAGRCGGNPVGDKWLYRFPHSGFPPYGERNADVPPGRALGDLYRLGKEVVMGVKKALVFGHSVTEKTP